MVGEEAEVPWDTLVRNEKNGEEDAQPIAMDRERKEGQGEPENEVKETKQEFREAHVEPIVGSKVSHLESHHTRNFDFLPRATSKASCQLELSGLDDHGPGFEFAIPNKARARRGSAPPDEYQDLIQPMQVTSILKKLSSFSDLSEFWARIQTHFILMIPASTHAPFVAPENQGGQPLDNTLLDTIPVRNTITNRPELVVFDGISINNDTQMRLVCATALLSHFHMHVGRSNKNLRFTHTPLTHTTHAHTLGCAICRMYLIH